MEVSEARIWKIVDDKPVNLEKANIDLEKNFETWITNNPKLIQFNITIIGRQFNIDGKFIDLLAVDSYERLLIIEIKRKLVDEKTFIQASKYTILIKETMEEDFDNLFKSIKEQYISKFEHEFPIDDSRVQKIKENYVKYNNDLLVYLVGTDEHPDLKLLTKHMTTTFPVGYQVILLNSYKDSDEEIYLSRMISDRDTDTPNDKTKISENDKLQELYEKAKQNGNYELLDRVLNFAEKYGFSKRIYPNCLMISPYYKKSVSFLTIWIYSSHMETDGDCFLYITEDPTVITRHFNERINEEKVQTEIGEILGFYREVTPDETYEILDRLGSLFDSE